MESANTAKSLKREINLERLFLKHYASFNENVLTNLFVNSLGAASLNASSGVLT